LPKTLDKTKKKFLSHRKRWIFLKLFFVKSKTLDIFQKIFFYFFCCKKQEKIMKKQKTKIIIIYFTNIAPTGVKYPNYNFN